MIGTELQGKLVHLRRLCNEDLERRIEWLNDLETARLFTGTAPLKTYSLVDANRWRKTLEADEASIVWAIESECGRHIGDVDLHGIERRYNSAKLTILLGDKAFWNKGCGTDTVRTVLHFAFSDLEMEKVNLRVFFFNKRAIRCYENSGFTRAVKAEAAVWPNSMPGEIHMTALSPRLDLLVCGQSLCTADEDRPSSSY